MIDTDLYSQLVTITSLPVCQGYIPQATGQPRVYFQRSSTENEYFVSGAQNLITTVYDIEVMALNPDSMSTTAEAIKTALDGVSGVWGTTHVLGSFVGDHSDEYEYKGFSSDENFHVAALKLTVLT